MEVLRDLSFLVLSAGFFSFAWFKFDEKSKEETLKEKIAEWWESSANEEDFLKKFEILLESHPTPRTEKSRKKAYYYLKKIQVILQKNYLREEKISHDIYERLLDLLDQKKENYAS